ncbi:neuronal regeneration-related protein isoform X1 [Pteropus medius]|nr:neuronal regeneration-related protein isoform X1 [Pteropus giganteus]XP_039704362.1 neuronal regeneration-related protein isoform X1 [Pteropus giganteus]XP_039704363.1 neuronal regeneration-related protein isoform X1 [Pteropus giganteus]XP_039704364.1 neuronal regeneration-related protein isoform X1 [Pteropus giganteus]XP_039704365.1 neuronal regeneration-related protein isoform X1 [Pteropus giganteus]XP_039704366.1 neuronal regeneration-related protein isoform X1 [Pteropus giganteus]
MILKMNLSVQHIGGDSQTLVYWTLTKPLLSAANILKHTNSLKELMGFPMAQSWNQEVYYPELSVWVSQEPFPNKEMEGRLPKGRLPVPKEVNRKKNDDAEAASLTPLGSNELHSPRISYLYSF